TDWSTDAALHRAALAALAPGHRATDFHRALRRADELLATARHDERVVVLVSDFQATGWAGTLENWKLSPGVSLATVDVGAGGADNAYVEAFHLTQRRAGAQTALRYDARVAAGAAASQAAAAALVVD